MFFEGLLGSAAQGNRMFILKFSNSNILMGQEMEGHGREVRAIKGDVQCTVGQCLIF